MSRLRRKLGFAHRHLWQSDKTYRLAFLAGPALLSGVLAACALWGLTGQGGSAGPGSPAPWAPASPSGPNFHDAEHPVALAPLRPLPGPDQQASFRTGWLVSNRRLTVDASADANVHSESLGAYHHDGATLTMQEMIEHGPRDGLFAATAAGLWRVEQPGHYEVSVRLTRPAGESAACITRLAFGTKPVFREEQLGMSDDFERTYGPEHVLLRPGLYPILVAFSCWSGARMSSGGEVTVLVQKPDGASAQPVAADQIIVPLIGS